MTNIDRPALEKMARGMRRVPGLKGLQSKTAWRSLRQDIAAREAQGLGPPRLGPRTTLIFFTLRSLLKRLLKLDRPGRRR